MDVQEGVGVWGGVDERWSLHSGRPEPGWCVFSPGAEEEVRVVDPLAVDPCQVALSQSPLPANSEE